MHDEDKDQSVDDEKIRSHNVIKAMLVAHGFEEDTANQNGRFTNMFKRSSLSCSFFGFI